ncbi:hypothetical protein SEA_JAMZY_59 [Gordonia phage Jamzy]|nr:hypothetical protein SEA_JAMZY_59 [Gordonia phage Jamzy]
MSFEPGDQVMVQSPVTGYDPPWSTGTVEEKTGVGWEGWVLVRTGDKRYMYPAEAVQHID